MIKYVFNVTQGRCHVKDKDTYIIAGWFKYDNPEENTIKLTFDDEQDISFDIKIWNTPDIRVKYAGYNAGVTKEYFLSFKLPENYSQYNKLKIYTVSSTGEEKVSMEILVDKIKSDQKYLDHWVDFCQFTEENIVITGWCVSMSPIEIRTYLPDGTRVPCEVSWHARIDVKALYHETSYLPNSGFSIKIKDSQPQIKTLVIVFKSGTLKTRDSVNVAERRRAWEKKDSFLEKWKANPRHHYVQRTVNFIKINGVKRFIERIGEKILQKNTDQTIYGDWLRKHTPSEEEFAFQQQKKFDYEPEFSIVVPLYKTPEKYLRDLVDSIREQTYSKWKLYLSDGSGAESPLNSLLDELEQMDARIKALRNEQQLRIAQNTNVALNAAEGDFIVFADHDDLLTRDALYECVTALNNDREIEFIYTDEDKISSDGKKYFSPHFKSDFNIDLLRSMNYFCHLCVVKKELLQKVGYLDPEYDGAQDYDFVLRCTEQTKHIFHIPKVLYHWRMDNNSTSSNPESKRYAFDAEGEQLRLIADVKGMMLKSLTDNTLVFTGYDISGRKNR